MTSDQRLRLIRPFRHALLSKARFQLTRPYEARHEFRPIGMVSGAVKLSVRPIASAPIRGYPARSAARWLSPDHGCSLGDSDRQGAALSQ